jgi:hypothetical protein
MIWPHLLQIRQVAPRNPSPHHKGLQSHAQEDAFLKPNGGRIVFQRVKSFVARIAVFSVAALLLASIFTPAALAGGKDVYVRGYIRSDGTYIMPHHRSAPDKSFWNNWSTQGNVNPYTGKLGARTSPSYSYPTYRLPSYSTPSYELPSYPSYSSPAYKLRSYPTYSYPTYKLPSYPSYSYPTYKLPSYPSYSGSTLDQGESEEDTDGTDDE